MGMFTVLPGKKLLSATKCRVDRCRVHAGVVALGGSLRLVAAERGPINPRLYVFTELKRRRNVAAIQRFSTPLFG